MGGPGGAGRVLGGVRDGLWGFLGGALSADEKSRLGVALYDASDEYRGAPRHAWEDEWLLRELPAAPARVLVGAAGAGREALLLEGRGYAVTALEPSPDLARLCRMNTADHTRVIEARYEDVAAGRGLAGATFDAVLLGLGSLSHVLDAAVRVDLLRALARSCERGPLLASVLSPPRSRGDRPLWSGGRAARWGRALARPLRAARRLPEVEPGEVVFGGLGFARLFTRPELEALGAAAGRLLRFDDGAPDGMELCAFLPE
jgi:hypothetical protein